MAESKFDPGFGASADERSISRRAQLDAIKNYLEGLPSLADFSSSLEGQGLEAPESTGLQGTGMMGLLDYQDNLLAQSEPMVWDAESGTMVPYNNTGTVAT